MTKLHNSLTKRNSYLPILARESSQMQKIIFTLLFLSTFNCFAQFNINAVDNFNRAKRALAKGKLDIAVEIFERLYKKYPNHTNINYLLGLCYTEEGFKNKKCIELLENSTKNINVNYQPHTHLEEHAPIFSWYYLTIAYCQYEKCADAQTAFKNFHTLYGLNKNDFYTQDCQKWMSECKIDDEPVVIATPPPPPVKQGIITKEIDYTTLTPLYGVQVASFSRFVPIYKFDGLKNVEAFMDTEGTIRYVIGHFGNKTQAQKLLRIVIDAGYTDAYIVDVNREKKYKEEIVYVDAKSVHNDKKRKISFKIQIGAFAHDSIPANLIKLYIQLDGIEEYKEENLVHLTTGNFKTYEQARRHKDYIAAIGIPGPFIVAFEKKQKVDVKEAVKYLEDHESIRNRN